jgi:hypothetical protein
VSKHIDPARDNVALEAEYFQTDQWAIDAILKRELVTPIVVDPCCGDGRMAASVDGTAATQIIATDKYDWGYKSGTKKIKAYHGVDWLDRETWPAAMHHPIATTPENVTVFMNPPFSLAEAFVRVAIEQGVCKIICFQRQVWRESQARKGFWHRYSPNRIYICGDRANCWLGTIPEDKRKGGSYQPHAWYVWEKGHPPGTLTDTIYKS